MRPATAILRALLRRVLQRKLKEIQSNGGGDASVARVAKVRSGNDAIKVRPLWTPNRHTSLDILCELVC